MKALLSNDSKTTHQLHVEKMNEHLADVSVESITRSLLTDEPVSPPPSSGALFYDACTEYFTNGKLH
jgi:hypothetical protein